MQETFEQTEKEMVDLFGIEMAIKYTKFAVKVQGQQFAPIITNPYELKEKLSKLKIFAERKRASLPTVAKIR